MDQNNNNRTSDKDIQQKTAIFLQIVYIFLEIIVGFPLMVIGAVALSHPDNWEHEARPVNTSAHGSYVAMVVVGVLIICLMAYSIYVLYRMLHERKENNDISLTTATMAATCLNFYGFTLIRESHGIISKMKQRKIAKKAAKKEKAAQKQAAKAQKQAKPKVAKAAVK
ncbi:hypothetical protein [Mesoplasma lactucae]|uniref:Uncharacterized protein n=1 Tax=Mesoplasma lactucae ATCC 49193 TaxID=81460 RepID=A0A291IS74_9MOLU|nr:hypothetical protein [Mesoplasma lactucae]ATG97722.1 hypothetical protein CP520_03220 [Mesoplasma lactucae ATCC 49193]ATZ20503.1 hypothetical protein MLACT_v1c06820 [Mesoplasma lactucae ATCC 49193]MCL8216674.1 hypothetical protein [Mesoplasma lactucae ATCC 49193]